MADSPPLDEEFISRLVARYTQRLMDAAALPAARSGDVSESCKISRDGQVLRLTCTITGSSYERPWDGSESEAITLVDEAADGTAYLTTKTPHYAWLRFAALTAVG